MESPRALLSSCPYTLLSQLIQFIDDTHLEDMPSVSHHLSSGASLDLHVWERNSAPYRCQLHCENAEHFFQHIDNMLNSLTRKRIHTCELSDSPKCIDILFARNERNNCYTELWEENCRVLDDKSSEDMSVKRIFNASLKRTGFAIFQRRRLYQLSE